jgi:hypothetical protein
MDGLGWRFMRAQIPQILLQPFKEVDGKPEVGSRNYLTITSYLQYTKMPQKKMTI